MLQMMVVSQAGTWVSCVISLLTIVWHGVSRCWHTSSTALLSPSLVRRSTTSLYHRSRHSVVITLSCRMVLFLVIFYDRQVFFSSIISCLRGESFGDCWSGIFSWLHAVFDDPQNNIKQWRHINYCHINNTYFLKMYMLSHKTEA